MAKNIFRIKLFLRSATPLGLIKEMQKNNYKEQREFDYDTPRLERDGRWYVWYFADTRPKSMTSVAESIPSEGQDVA